MCEELKKALQGCKFFTLKDNGINELSQKEDSKFRKMLECLERATQFSETKRRTITFRGVEKDYLSSRLNEYEKINVLSTLFIVGDKAQSFYQTDINESTKQVLTSIQECTPTTLDYIFKEIQDLLQTNDLINFSRNNPEFVDFFKDDNKPNFSNYSLSLRKKIRDYYLYLLHTADNNRVKAKSFLVSTSIKYAIADDFSCDDYVIVYIVPAPLGEFAVTHLFPASYEKELKNKGFPLYEGTAIHPNEQEVAIKGALFPTKLLGIKDIRDNKFIVNPHIFEAHNTPSSIVYNKLKIDLSNQWC